MSAAVRPAMTPRAMLAAVLVAVVVVAPAGPAHAHTGPASSAGRGQGGKPSPPPGWASGRIRLEPLGPDQELDIPGDGAYPGAIELSPGAGGVKVTNAVSFDQYLQGVA